MVHVIDPITYFLLFFKATLFSSGGFSNLASLHQDLIKNRWAMDSDFSQSIAIGQVSPGPNGLWVISLGYLTYGYLGAALALIAITLPPLLVLVTANVYGRIESHCWVAGFMRGISLAVIGILLTVVWSIMSHSARDWRSWLIAIISCGLALNRRVPILLILLLAGVAGYFIYH